jgi:fatty-acyl-CoA synthase
MEPRLAAKPELSYVCDDAGPPLWGCTIGEALDGAAALYPGQPALVARHQQVRYTYRELLAAVERAARGFLRLGVQKGDRVGI